ncbi:MAG: cytochrome c [Flavobacteriales bacterium]|nr:cytochrome c [Flavobacteriales bacterium]MCC6937044.1 cytochrome c [Flavobacteriales bacterium]
MRHLTKILGFLLITPLVHLPAAAQNGEQLFKQTCSACHQMGRRLVGPDLTGVTERRTKEWIHAFVKSSQTVIKSGDADAVALSTEFNGMIMPDQSLSAGDVDQIIAYFQTFSATAPAGTTEVAATAEVPVEYTDADRETGQALFVGRTRFANRGAACISCHNVTNDQVMLGGGFAKDLTGVFGRMGNAGVAGILGAPPFPAMATTYANSPLTEVEIHSLVAFLENADKVSAQQAPKSAYMPFMVYGGGGLIALLALIGLHWRGRMKKGVKHDIYDRQLRSI